jgi:hypothetical protein
MTKNRNSDDDQEPNKKSSTWGNAVRTEMRVTGGRRELKKTIHTSTIRWRKQNFPKVNPPPEKDSKPSKTTHGEKKKIQHILKSHQDTHPSSTETYAPIIPTPPPKLPTSSYENPSAGRPSTNTSNPPA